MTKSLKSVVWTVFAVWGLMLLIIGMSFSLGGCAARSPRPPAPAPTRVIAVEVASAAGLVSGAHVKVAQGGPTFEGDTNPDGYVELHDVPVTSSPEWRVWITAATCEPYSVLVQLSPGNHRVRVGTAVTEPIDLAAPALDCAPQLPPAPPLAGRLHAQNGRFANDAGFVQWLGVSEFDFVHLVRTGQEGELVRRLTRDVTIGHRNVVRIFARAINLFDLHDDQPEYWPSLDRTIAIVNSAGAYVELVLLPDAQSLSGTTRRTLVQAYGERYRDHPGVVFQITNEPWNKDAQGTPINGFGSAVDPDLIALGDLLASVIGHRDFSIGDPQDGDDADASAQTVAQSITLAKHANILVIHSSRMGGAQPAAERYRRYIDHGESFADVMAEARKVNGGVACVNDEPMGVASQRWVPIPGRAPYEREFEPEAVLADELTTLFIGCGHTFHYISAQDDGTPGLDLLGRLSPRISADPSWTYRNDSWTGSATRGFEGFGKVRTTTNGIDGFVLANGTVKGRVTFANGFAPQEVLFDGAHVTVWAVGH